MLEPRIEALFEKSPEDFTHQDLETFEEFKRALNAGAARAAEPDPAAPHGWRVNAWVKRGILVGFRMGRTVDMTDAGSRFTFWDKATYPPRKLTIEDGVRVVPGGVEPARRLLRGQKRHLHAADVYQRRGLRGRRLDGPILMPWSEAARRSARTAT